MKRLALDRWLVTEPTPVCIGKPANPPTDEALGALRIAVSGAGADVVYWFWPSVSGDQPHLGLAVAPDDDAVVAAIGEAAERVWSRFSPSNQAIDVLRLGGSSLDATILKEGQLLCQRATPRPVEQAHPADGPGGVG